MARSMILNDRHGDGRLFRAPAGTSRRANHASDLTTCRPLPSPAPPRKARSVATIDKTTRKTPSDDKSSFRPRYNQIMSRLRYIATAPLRRLPDNDYLSALHRGALILAKRVYHGIQQPNSMRSDTSSSRISPAALLTAGESLLNRHDRQQQILVELKEYALELCGLIADMPRERPPKYSKLADLADRIIEQAGPQPNIADVLPQPGLPVVEILAGELPTRHPRVYVEAVAAAQLIAWMGADRLKTPEQLQQLVVAALLRDVGCLLLDPDSIDKHGQLAEPHRRLYRRHPRLSAAMIGRIHQPPVVVARLVARHHERLDGSGFPANLSDMQFNEPLRILTAADEYIVMCRPAIPVGRFVAHADLRRREVAAELTACATRGQLDRRWIDRITGGISQVVDQPATMTNHAWMPTAPNQLRVDPVQPPGPLHLAAPVNGQTTFQKSAVPQPH